MGGQSKKSLSKFQNISAIKSLHALRWALGVLPRWLIRPISEGLFSIAVLCTKRLNMICVKNLKSVYGATKSTREYQAMSRACIKNVGRCMIDTLYYIQRPAKLEKIVTIEGEEHLIEALKEGKGCLAISAHLSNFPLLFLFLVRRGYGVNVIIRPMRDNNFGQFMEELCARWGIRMIQTVPRKNFIKQALGALKSNELLFILFDEIPVEADIKVDFFGRKVGRAAGPVLFQQRTGSPVLPIFIVQDKNKHFKIIIKNRVEFEYQSDEEENKRKNISKLTEITETLVCAHPLQWGGWLNKRWTAE